MFQKSDDAVVYPIRMLLPHVQFEVDPDALQTTPLLPNPRVYWLCPAMMGIRHTQDWVTAFRGNKQHGALLLHATCSALKRMRYGLFVSKPLGLDEDTT